MADSGTEQSPGRTATGSVETKAPLDAVVAVLADARHLPTWAPGFVDAVAGDAESGWTGTKGDQTFAIRVPVNPLAGTVDYLREIAPGREGGAYLRAVQRPGNGTVIVMTLPMLPGTDPSETAAILAEELAALAALVAESG